MSQARSRSTVYFDPELRKALRVKAAWTQRSLSDLVNEAVRRALQEDLAAFDERANEPTMTYEELLRDLKAHGKRLLFRKSVAKDLRGIPKKDVARILRRFNALTDEPRGPSPEKLSGQKKYRVCKGAYRIIYEIRDDVLEVLMVPVGHRRDVYRSS